MNNSENNYREILENSLKHITEEMALLQSQSNGLMKVITQSEKRLEKLKIEQKHIQAELQMRIKENQTIEPGVLVGTLDSKIENILKKKETQAEKVAELEELKSNVSSRLGSAIINRRSRRAIKKLQNQQCRINLISDIQKALLMPKYIVEKFKLGRYSKKTGKVSYAQNKIDQINQKRQNLDPENKIIDSIKDAIYDIKGEYYANKLEKAQEKLKKLQTKGVQNHILGANVVAMTKKDINNLRKRMSNAKKKAIQQTTTQKQQAPKQNQQTPIQKQQPTTQNQQTPIEKEQTPIEKEQTPI